MGMRRSWTSPLITCRLVVRVGEGEEAEEGESERGEVEVGEEEEKRERTLERGLDVTVTGGGEEVSELILVVQSNNRIMVTRIIDEDHDGTRVGFRLKSSD